MFGSNKIQRRLSDGNSDDDLDDDHATVRAARNTAKRATDVLTQVYGHSLFILGLLRSLKKSYFLFLFLWP